MNRSLGIFSVLAALLITGALSSCGGNGGGGGGSSSSPPASYSVGGQARGVNIGASLVLQVNGGNNLSVTSNGTFTFAAALSSGSTYNITVATQPAGQNCTVANGSGTVFGPVSSVSVRCRSFATFSVAASFASGTNPHFTAVGDFNGDGNVDLAVAIAGSTTISILLGDGAGSFGSATNFTVGTAPEAVAVGDFNGDGKLDLAVANSGGGNVSILLGNGAGSFGAATNFNAGTGPGSVAVGDFNGDGRLDLAVANSGGGNVSILLGNGAGSFGAATSFAAGTGPSSVAVGDINGDGKLDLAVANSGGGNVSILIGNGAGSFGAATNFTVGTTPRSVAIGDFNGNGKPDLAVANAGGNVSVLLGDGAGSFGSAVNFPAGTSPSSVITRDVNKDGKLDLVVANNGSSNISVLHGDGTGSFGAPANFPAGANPFAVAIGDFNKDGKPDLAVANAGSSNVSILGNTTPFTSSGSVAMSAPTNIPTSSFPFAVGTKPEAVAIGDFNRDGKLDIVVANSDTNNVSIVLGNGAGSFGAPTVFSVGVTGVNPESLAIGDFNGDGKLDLAVANYNSSNVSILLGTGTGSFGPATIVPVGLYPHSVVIGDINGDGKLDLAVPNSGDSNVSILLGTGTGTFSTSTTGATGTAPWSVAIGDLNGDGKLDLATANLSSDTVSIMLGTGTGSFGAATNYAASMPPNLGKGTPWSVAIGDLDGDGKLDLAVSHQQNPTYKSYYDVTVLYGVGDGTFLVTLDVVVGPLGGVVTNNPYGMVVGDFNDDGKLDFAVAKFNTGNASIVLGTGAPIPNSFYPVVDYAAGLQPYSLAAGDFNGDGSLDLVTANSGGSNVSVLLQE